MQNFPVIIVSHTRRSGLATLDRRADYVLSRPISSKKLLVPTKLPPPPAKWLEAKEIFKAQLDNESKQKEVDMQNSEPDNKENKSNIKIESIYKQLQEIQQSIKKLHIDLKHLQSKNNISEKRDYTRTRVCSRCAQYINKRWKNHGTE